MTGPVEPLPPGAHRRGRTRSPGSTGTPGCGLPASSAPRAGGPRSWPTAGVARDDGRPWARALPATRRPRPRQRSRGRKRKGA